MYILHINNMVIFVFLRDLLGGSRTCPQKQHGVDVSVQRQLLVHGDLDVVDAALEHERPHAHRVHLAGHERVPPDERQHVVGQVPGRVDALRPVQVGDALERREERLQSEKDQDVKQ